MKNANAKKSNARIRGTERLRWKTAGVASVAVWALGATAANAQRLWSVGEATRAPDGPAVTMEDVRAAPGAGGPGGEALPRVSAEVQVTYDYLRLGMGYLELPLPDGSAIEAENAVFEDRGGGNLMWTGEVPGAGYESVLFTVQDGHLVGWFGEPGGPKYVVYAGPDGRGSLAEEVGPTGDWCGVEAGPGRDLARDAASALDRPASAASGSSGDRLDILLLYPEGTERYWRVIGGPAVGVRQLGDYLNMVFRNGEIPATANLIPARWDPKLASHPSTQGSHLVHQRASTPWHWELDTSVEVDRLRRRYKPDLMHFAIPPLHFRGAAGGQAFLRRNFDTSILIGWSRAQGRVFAHEIGHNLGGRHEPAQLGDYFEQAQSRASEDLRPYVFGHTDMASCARREGHGDDLLCPVTTMSYGVEARRDDDPLTVASAEPFYSSVRHKPNGWTIGVAGTSEVERLLHETVPVAVNGGEAPWRAEQYPRRLIDVRWTGHDTVRVDWSDDWRSRDNGRVKLALAEGTTDDYWWFWDFESDEDDPRLIEQSAPNVTPIVRADGSQVGVEVSGLRPGGRYRVAVLGPGRHDLDTRTDTAALLSDVFHLEPRGRASGSPEAASRLGARATGPDGIRLHWRDNSRVETGYEVWYRKWSAKDPDKVWRRYGESPADSTSADIAGLSADEEVQVGPLEARTGRYSFVVVAYNDSGWNASETFHLETMPGPHPAPTASGEITDCLSRQTGIDLDGFQVRACLETPDGARRRMWDYRLEADRSGLLYFFERDNAEILVKVLDGCAINGHRWVFVAPVTTLPFRLEIREPGPEIEGRRQVWHYDSELPPRDGTVHERVGNPKDRTARTVSDTTAFSCTTAETAAAKAASASAGPAPFGAEPPPRAAANPARPPIAGARSDCEPGGRTLTLRGGYTVSMCYETYDGLVGDARDWGLDSTQSGLMYFFERDNVEVLIKVLDGCGVNGHRWVFVAPVTDLAFNLIVESPSGERWTHTNRLGRTADAASDTAAFPCGA